MDRDQGSANRSDHPGRPAPCGRIQDRVALADMGGAAHDGGGDDRRQRGALGDGLRDAKADRQDGHERKPAADADGPAQHAGDQPADHRRGVGPGHGSTSCLMPTSSITIATPRRSCRSGIRFKARAPM